MNETYSFGYWVRRRRKALDLTQATLAHDVGCAIVTIRKIERDERRPSRMMAERLAGSLGIAEEECEAFILSGLGEVSVYRMPVPSEPIPTYQELETYILPSGEKIHQLSDVLTSILEARSTPRNNLPAQSTAFIGRETELAEIRAKLVEHDCRLLTLLGPGGSGKTRLAIEAAGGLLPDYQHGVFFVSLAPLQSVEIISSTIASVLRFSFFGEGALDEQLLGYLRNKQLLLILDNFEHLLDSACLVLDILNAAPDVKILVTSRARLMVTGEHVFDVWGMSYPQSLIPVEIASDQFSAVKLFETQARRVQGNFQLSDNNLRDVIQICALLEGMPLGLVLAASWAAMLTSAEIAAEIGRNLEFLEKELRDLPPRQRSLRSVFNHSWQLLSENQRQILAALSVFRNEFTRKAAREVVNASLSDLMGLIDKSILHQVAEGRFEVHELIRQFAGEKLGLNPAKEDRTREMHSAYYCQALAGWERDFNSPRKCEALDEMVIEIDNIRASWKWAVEKIKPELLSKGIRGLFRFYARRYRYNEGEAACRSLVEKLDDSSDSGQIRVDHDVDSYINSIDRLTLLALALGWQGGFSGVIGNQALGRQHIQRSLSILERPELADQDIRYEKGIALNSLSWMVKFGSADEAKQLAINSLEYFRSLGDYEWMSSILNHLGHITSSNVVESRKFFRKSLAFRRKMCDTNGMAHTLDPLALLTARQGLFSKAEEMVIENLAITREQDDLVGMMARYGTLGTILVWQGKFTEARALDQKILAAFDDLANSQNPSVLIIARAGFSDLYLGNYEAARNQAQLAIDLFREIELILSQNGTAMAYSILGGAALAERSFTEADDWFSKCILVFRTFGGDLSQTLACQGYVDRGLKRISQAQANFLDVLQKSTIEEDFLPLIHALPGIALLFADRGEVERAVELYALASTQGIVANSKWFDDIAGNEIARMAEELPKEVAEVAKVRGQGLDLWETAEGLLDAFESRGWISDQG